MSDSSSTNPHADADRQQWEARVIAMIMGEASDFECEQVLAHIAADPEWEQFYLRMLQLHGMLGEVAYHANHRHSADEANSDSVAAFSGLSHQLSTDRRQALLHVLDTQSEPPRDPSNKDQVAEVIPPARQHSSNHKRRQAFWRTPAARPYWATALTLGAVIVGGLGYAMTWRNGGMMLVESAASDEYKSAEVPFDAVEYSYDDVQFQPKGPELQQSMDSLKSMWGELPVAQNPSVNFATPSTASAGPTTSAPAAPKMALPELQDLEAGTSLAFQQMNSSPARSSTRGEDRFSRSRSDSVGGQLSLGRRGLADSGVTATDKPMASPEEIASASRLGRVSGANGPAAASGGVGGMPMKAQSEDTTESIAVRGVDPSVATDDAPRRPELESRAAKSESPVLPPVVTLDDSVRMNLDISGIAQGQSQSILSIDQNGNAASPNMRDSLNSALAGDGQYFDRRSQSLGDDLYSPTNQPNDLPTQSATSDFDASLSGGEADRQWYDADKLAQIPSLGNRRLSEGGTASGMASGMAGGMGGGMGGGGLGNNESMATNGGLPGGEGQVTYEFKKLRQQVANQVMDEKRDEKLAETRSSEQKQEEAPVELAERESLDTWTGQLAQSQDLAKGKNAKDAIANTPVADSSAQVPATETLSLAQPQVDKEIFSFYLGMIHNDGTAQPGLTPPATPHFRYPGNGRNLDGEASLEGRIAEQNADHDDDGIPSDFVVDPQQPQSGFGLVPQVNAEKGLAVDGRSKGHSSEALQRYDRSGNASGEPSGEIAVDEFGLFEKKTQTWEVEEAVGGSARQSLKELAGLNSLDNLQSLPTEPGSGSVDYGRGVILSDLDSEGTVLDKKQAVDQLESRLADRREGGRRLARVSEPEQQKPSEGINEILTSVEPFSTFSLHVSDVSFKLANSALSNGQYPEPDKVRIEEFVNALDYHDPIPAPQDKVQCVVEQAIHPFYQQRNVMRVSMNTAASGRSSSVPLRLTLLLDNSGSMDRIDRSQTVRRVFETLTQQLSPEDQITLISFASQPRLLADQVRAADAEKLVALIDSLPSEGGTNIETALQLATEKAAEQRLEGAMNRVVLLTDGAVNLGDANPERLSQMVTAMRDAGIAFDAAGISAQDLNDNVLESLTRKGDGRYYLLDSDESVDERFTQQIAGALRPAAGNVKVQVEFNPNRVSRYKLLGYEKHTLNKEDFRNDQVDAAEMAAAESGVAVYQFEAEPDGVGDIGSVSVRFQDLESGRMVERRWPIPYDPNAPRIDQATPTLKLATAAALFAAKLGGQPIGESVDLEALLPLVTDLPEEHRNNQRVQQLQDMIQKVRDLNP